VDLSAWQGANANTRTLTEITDHIMLVLRDMVAQLRDGTPPPLWQPGQRSLPSTPDRPAGSTPDGQAGTEA
jgi:hypothetical protein